MQIEVEDLTPEQIGILLDLVKRMRAKQLAPKLSLEAKAPPETGFALRHEAITNLAANGFNYTQIGHAINLCEASVKAYAKILFAKTGARNKTELVYKLGVCAESGKGFGNLADSPQRLALACQIAEGKTNEELAGFCGLSLPQIKNEVRVICKLIGAKNRTHIAGMWNAWKAGI